MNEIQVTIESTLPEVRTTVEMGTPEVDVSFKPTAPAVDVVVNPVGLPGRDGRDGVDGDIASMDLVLGVVNDHVNDPAPHPAYDDGPSFVLLYMNAKV